MVHEDMDFLDADGDDHVEVLHNLTNDHLDDHKNCYFFLTRVVVYFKNFM